MNSKKEIFKNFIAFIFSDVVVLLLGLVSRSIFIKSIGDYFLGITALMNSVIGILALSNLGLGDAIVYYLIEKFSKGEKKEIQSVFSFSKRVFRIIMGILVVFSILLIPFLKFFIPDIRDYNAFLVYYMFFVVSKILTYQIGPYNAVIRADQKIRVIQIGTLLGYFICTILQIVAMLINGSYLIYIMLMLLGTCITNIYIKKYFYKNYKWVLNGVDTLSDIKKKEIFQKVKDVFMTRISSALIDTTDNLLITRFIGTETVGLYSNYVMIIQNVRSLAKNLYNSMESSIGIHTVKSKSEVKLSLYKSVLFGYHLIASIFFIGIAILMQNFIMIWIGDNYLLSNVILLTMAFDLYLNILLYAQTGFITTSNVFNKIKVVYFVGAILNIIFSIVLVYFFGLAGIIFGTLLSRVICNFPVGLFYLCKDQFNCSLKKILFLNIIYIIQVFLIFIITNYIMSKFVVINFIDFMVKGVLVVLITIILNIVLNFKNSEFIIYKNKFLRIIKK